MLVAIVVIINLFFWHRLLANQVPIPLDALVGVYHPWADQFWGFVAGVPYKNISLTDVFSQLFPWRIAAVEAIRNWQWPLWNPYSFSGYPLAANWQSAPFFPLNILLLIFGDVTGYGILVAIQSILATTFMLAYLREIKLSRIASLVGAISFAFGGYMMTYLTWATTGYILTCIPAGLFLVERFIATEKKLYLLLLSLTIFFVMTGGFFQPALFALLIIGGYSALMTIATKRKLALIQIYLWMVLGIGLAAIQVVPVLELLSLSVRSADHNIEEYNYGLLPIRNLVTLLAPDFFGNPSTGNYFGPIQYQEASGYFGIVSLILAITNIFYLKRKNTRQNFFIVLFFLSLVLAYDGPVGKAVFDLKLPLISTGYASRWLMVTGLAGSILAAFGMEITHRKEKIMLTSLAIAILGGVAYQSQILVSIRNLILPLGLVCGALFLFILPRKSLVLGLIFVLAVFDLTRYGRKFTPMADKRYGTTEIPILNRVRELAGINRVAFDQGPIVPANTWMYARIQAIGGYDPLLYKDYGIWFRALNIGHNPSQKIDGSLGAGAMTRYLNLDNPYSPLLDLAGVKYLMTLKKGREGHFNSGGEINKELLKKYSVLDDEGATVLLENKTAFPRFGLFYEAESEMNDAKAAERLVAGFDFRKKIILKTENPVQFKADPGNTVQLSKYTANLVEIKAKTRNGAYLLLTDTDYPGWRARVNQSESKIIRADGIFRAVELPAGESTVEFSYFPQSFRIGLMTSFLSALIILGLTVLGVSNGRF